MPRTLVMRLGDDESHFDFQKLDRKKLYGSRRRLNLDAAGEPCKKASLTRDGLFLLVSGMTSQGYFADDDQSWIPNADLVGLVEGEPIEKQPGTLGVAQDITPASAQDLLDLRLTTVYILTDQEVSPELRAQLDAGKIFRFPFNYRADYQMETAFLVSNSAGTFALVGTVATPTWVEPNLVAPIIDDEDEDEDDDLDFEMF
jgi:hypothetical protein